MDRDPPGTDPMTNVLRRAIVEGEFHPNERLVEEQLAQRFATTRPTIRMALSRLEHEGLVVRERHRGARVRLVSEREAIEIFETRCVLEALVARYAALNARDADIARLRAIVEELEALERQGDAAAYLQMADRNAELHEQLVRIARHETAARLLAFLHSQIVRFQYAQVAQPGRAAHSVAEHRELIEAVARRDPQAAEAAMQAHMTHAADALRTAIALGKHRTVLATCAE